MSALFLQAARQKWRFDSSKGNLTAEQLFDLPLTGEFSLNSVAQKIHQSVETRDSVNFVEDVFSDEQVTLKAKLALVVEVINIRKAEAETAKNKAARAAERRKLVDLLARKRDAALEELDESQILKKLEELEV